MDIANDTTITTMDRGNDTTNGSIDAQMESGKITASPVRSLQTGRNTLVPVLTKRARNRYDRVPAVMLAIAAFLSGFFEYRAWKYAGSNAAAVIPMNTDVALAIMSFGMR